MSNDPSSSQPPPPPMQPPQPQPGTSADLASSGWGAPAPWTGQPGRTTSVGLGILLFVVTCGLYGLYWSYVTHEDIKRTSGEGIGGVVGLLLWFVISPVSGFIIPGEIKTMYERAGERSPVDAMTGLWLFPGIFLIVPAIIWYARVQGALNDFYVRRGAQPV